MATVSSQPFFFKVTGWRIERRRPGHPISLMDSKLTPAGPRSESRESYLSAPTACLPSDSKPSPRTSCTHPSFASTLPKPSNLWTKWLRSCATRWSGNWNCAKTGVHSALKPSLCPLAALWQNPAAFAGRHCVVCYLQNCVANSRSDYDFLSDMLVSETNHRQFDRFGRGSNLLEAQVVFPDSASKISISCAESEFILWLLLPRSPSDGAVCTAEFLAGIELSVWRSR